MILGTNAFLCGPFIYVLQLRLVILMSKAVLFCTELCCVFIMISRNFNSGLLKEFQFFYIQNILPRLLQNVSAFLSNKVNWKIIYLQFSRKYVGLLPTHSHQQSMPKFVSELHETFSLPVNVAVAAELIFQCLSRTPETGSNVLFIKKKKKSNFTTF